MTNAEPGVLAAVRRQHELRVLGVLSESGPTSRKNLEHATGLSRTTLSAIVGDLLRRSAVIEHDPAPAGPGLSGRPTRILGINPSSGSALGINLGRGHLSACFVDYSGAIIASDSELIALDLDVNEKLLRATALVQRLAAAHGLSLNALLGVGVGISSMHPDPQASGQEPVDLAPLRALSTAPILWDHNIRISAMAEASRCLDQDLLYVSLSHGISCGILVGGTIARGGAGLAGELGHMCVDPDGPECWCGGRGCLERYLSIQNLLAEAARRGRSYSDIAEWTTAAHDGEPVAVELAAWAAELLGRAVANLTMLLDPQRIVLAGELAALGELLLEPLRRSLAGQRLDIRERRTTLAVSAFAAGAGSYGAAHMALSRWGSAAAPVSGGR